MNIVIYTLTRDRLFYTQYCFEMLREKTRHPFVHIVFDNGSRDDTPRWLNEYRQQYGGVFVLPCSDNMGIGQASNKVLDFIGMTNMNPTLVIKMDNDCEVISDGILEEIVEIYKDLKMSDLMNLSPKVDGIVHQPKRYKTDTVANHKIGLTHHIGGLFSIVPYCLYHGFRYPESIPKAKGCDSYLSTWIQSKGHAVGYIEDLVVNHYETTDGQKIRYPEYFKRKTTEEQTK